MNYPGSSELAQHFYSQSLPQWRMLCISTFLNYDIIVIIIIKKQILDYYISHSKSCLGNHDYVIIQN